MVDDLEGPVWQHLYKLMVDDLERTVWQHLYKLMVDDLEGLCDSTSINWWLMI